MDTIYLIGQIILGGYFILAGLMHFVNVTMMTGYASSKGIPMARSMVLGSGVLLIAGGIGILTQFMLEESYIVLIGFLFLAAVTIHPFWKAKDAQSKMADMVNFQKNIALASALAMLLATIV